MTYIKSEADVLPESVMYKALLIPLTIMGVNYYYFILEGILLFGCFIFSKQLAILLLGLPFHILGVLLQRLDPHFMPLMRVHLLSLRPCPNAAWWGGKSYAA